MRRYILEEKIDVSYNASSKARDDVTKFVCTYQSKDGLGYSVIGHNNKTNIHSNIKKVLIGVEAVKELLLSLKKDDILFIQSSFKILRLVDAVKRIIRFRTIYLIHDIDALRVSFNDYDRVKETIQAYYKYKKTYYINWDTNIEWSLNGEEKTKFIFGKNLHILK